MIVITGAAGFIGSCMVARLNASGRENLILVDDFNRPEKATNLRGKKFLDRIDRHVFFDWLETEAAEVEVVYHLGARTDTTEFNTAIFNELNLNYTKTVWNICTAENIPLVYASSAATYGLGEKGYKDDHALVPGLKPLNPYGESKNNFDKWALEQEEEPPRWYGLKFFNVYGPNEYHKGRMASVVWHAFHQIKTSGEMKLFRSHNPEYKDGEQLRDFVYVKDVVDVCLHLSNAPAKSGLYNLGTGKARSFNDLAVHTFKAMGLEPKISYIDTPEDIRDTYQYFTQAQMAKLKKAGYDRAFFTLEEGITDYVRNYLTKNTPY